VLSSEDEVAVVFLPEAPYPVLSLALVNVRFALRRAHRAGLLSQAESAALVRAAENRRYQDRSWDTIAEDARIKLSAKQLATLQSCDVKREDVLSCCHSTARQLRLGKIAASPRRDRTQPLGSLSEERERSWDPLDGEDPDEIRAAFLDWLWLSGQVIAITDLNATAADIEQGGFSELMQSIDIRKPSAELEALLMRFIAFRRSVQLAEELHPACTPEDQARARYQIASAHAARDWAHLIGRYGPQSDPARKLRVYANDRARIDVLVRDILSRRAGQDSATIPIWKRSRQPGQSLTRL
jgi:hypothetical protein